MDLFQYHLITRALQVWYQLKVSIESLVHLYLFLKVRTLYRIRLEPHFLLDMLYGCLVNRYGAIAPPCLAVLHDRLRTHVL